MPAAIPLVLTAFAGASGAAAAFATGASLGAEILGGLELAGSVVSGIGQLTGNTKLAKIGGIAMAVGGIGAALGGAGPLTELLGGQAAPAVGDALGGASTAASAASGATDAAGATSAGQAPTIADSITNGSTAASSAAPTAAAGAAPSVDTLGVAGSAPAGSLAQSASVAPASVAPAGDSLAQTYGVVAPDVATATQPPGLIAQSMAGSSGYSPEWAASPSGFQGASQTAAPEGGLWNGIKSAVGDAASYIKQNPGVAQVAGSAITGAGNFLSQNQVQKQKLQQQIDYQNWVRQKYSDSLRNVQVPTVQFAKPGLIGTQMAGG